MRVTPPSLDLNLFAFVLCIRASTTIGLRRLMIHGPQQLITEHFHNYIQVLGVNGKYCCKRPSIDVDESRYRQAAYVSEHTQYR